MSARSVGAFALACLVCFVLVEAASRLWLAAHGGTKDQASVSASRRHTRYDAELGWVNIPGVSYPDFFGPGRSLTINAQGFRGDREYSDRVPEGRLRVVCSGDSFTLGSGVDDTETWCAGLSARDPRFETVNMGQGGYGIGQAWLWYARDAAPLDHDVHVFAFISADFARMLSDTFLGVEKPVLRMREGGLVTENVPVPRPSIAARIRRTVTGLRVLQVARSLLPARSAHDRFALPFEDLPWVASLVFEALQRANAAKESDLLLVYLPMSAELRAPVDPRLPRFVRQAARQRGIAYVDLLAEIQKLPEATARDLFFDSAAASAAAGHFNARGNAWVADHVHTEISRLVARREERP